MIRRMIAVGALLAYSALINEPSAGCGPTSKPPSSLPQGIEQPAARLTSVGVTSGYEFKEVNGVVSMEAEHASWWRGFDIWPGVSGKAMRLREPYTRDNSASACLRFKVYFSTPGKYAVWNFGRIENVQYAGNEFSIQYGCTKQYTGATTPGSCGSVYLEDQAGHIYTRTYTGTWSVPSTAVMHWSSYLKEGKTSKATGQLTADESKCPCYEEADAKSPGMINVTSPGYMNIDYMATNECGIILDKMVFTRVNITTKPTGTGPAETVGTTSVAESAKATRSVATPGLVKSIRAIQGTRAPSLSIAADGTTYDIRGVVVSRAGMRQVK